MILEWLYKKWTIEDNILKNSDCYLVLSYAVKKNEPTLPTRALIVEVKKQYLKNPHAYVIMSTGDNQFLGISNARIMKDYGVKIGIPKEKIFEERISKNTYENLLYSKKILQEKKLRYPTLICLDLHSKRAVAIANKLGWSDFGWISVFSKGEGAYGYKWIQTYSRFTIFIYEIIATIYCTIKGQM
jgi:uncharacterized SAM-binding protein YcdF (DUF218 family)